MHKRIADAIVLAFSQDPVIFYESVSIRAYRLFKTGDLSKGNGFWAVRIVAKKGGYHLLPCLKRGCLAIGEYYYERLDVEETKHTIKFS